MYSSSLNVYQTVNHDRKTIPQHVLSYNPNRFAIRDPCGGNFWKGSKYGCYFCNIRPNTKLCDKSNRDVLWLFTTLSIMKVTISILPAEITIVTRLGLGGGGVEGELRTSDGGWLVMV